MASQNVASSGRDQQLNEVLAAYLEAVDSGRQVDRRAWLRRYPELAGELAEFFANRDRLAPLAEASHTVDLADMPEPNGDGTAASAATFGHYEILEEIARGGMGVVYRARHTTLKRVVALKMIASGNLAGTNAMRRFRTEAEAAASLDHPNIVPVYEVGEHDGNHYFTMKLIEGGDLAHWLAKGRVPLAKVSRRLQQDMARLLAAVARAVHHAHQRGVLHRDLKPANILLQRAADQAAQPLAPADLRSAVPMVTDFGLAKRARADGEVSQSLTIVGTACYMAPEQAHTAGPLTVAADVYSLGAVLYEMLTGRPPFRGETYLETLMQVVQEQPVPPRQIHARIDQDLESICLRCLAKAPEDRYAGADVLARDLENWAAGEPVSVRQLGSGERLWRWCWRNKVVTLLLLAMAGLMVGGGVYSTLLNLQLTAAAGNLEEARDAAERNARAAEANAGASQTHAGQAAQNAEREAQARADAVQNAQREAQARADAVQALEIARAALKQEKLALDEEKIQRAKSRQLLVGQYVSNGAALCDAGDPLGALAWFGEALNLDQGDPVREKAHRIRLAAALRRCPRLVQVAFHTSSVRVFCLSGDGKRLFTTDRDGLARLWDTAEDKTWTLRPADGSPTACAVFSPDSRLLATGHDDGHVRLWDAAAGALVGQPMKHTAAVTCVVFGRDGQNLLTASKDGTARVWESPTGKPLCAPVKHGAEVTLASFNADGRSVVTVGTATDGGSEAKVWDWAAGKQVGKPLRHKLAVTMASFSPDSQRLFTSASNHNLRIWDLTTGKALAVNGSLANAGAGSGPWFSPEGQRVLLAKGTQARIVDLATAQPVGRPLTHGGDVLLAAFSLDGRQVVTAGWDRVVRVWDVQTGQPLTPPLLHPRRVQGLAFDATGQRLVTVGEDNAVRLWDIRSRDQAAPPLYFKSAGEVLALAPGGRAVLTANNGVPRLWEVAGDHPLTPPLGASKVTQAVFSPDGRRVATLDAEALRVWDLTAKSPMARVLRPAAKVQQFVFSPDGSRIVARLAGNEVRVWDAATAAEVTVAKEPADSPWKQLVVSPDGRRLLALKLKQQVQVWDLATGKLALPAIKHAAAVLQAAWSPDGLRLATACADGTVRIWDAQTGEPLTPPLPHGNALQLVGFSLDGRLVATAGSDGTARVWDATTGQPLTPLWRQGEGVTAVSFSPDGGNLATTSKSGTVRLWDLRADGRPATDLLLLVRILSGQHMHPTSGSFVPFDVGDLRHSWPQLRARFPAEFGHY